MKTFIRKNVALVLALALCVSLLPFAAPQRALAETVSIKDYVRGLENGKLFLGKTIGINVGEVIDGIPAMKASHDKCMTFFVTVYLSSTTGGDEVARATDNTNVFTYTVPAEPKVNDSHIRDSMVIGKNLKFQFQFYDGSDHQYYWSENFPVYGDLTKVKLPALPSRTYTGKPLTPSLKTLVYDETSGYKLTEGTDYTVSCRNNVNAGTATVTVTGTGYFVGQITGTFKINKAANPLKVKGKTATVKYSVLQKKNVTLKKAAVLSVTKAQGKVTFKKLSGVKKISIDKNTGKVTVMKGLPRGTYKVKVKVSAAGNKNYFPGSKTVTFTVKVK